MRQPRAHRVETPTYTLDYFEAENNFHEFFEVRYRGVLEADEGMKIESDFMPIETRPQQTFWATFGIKMSQADFFAKMHAFCRFSKMARGILEASR